MKTLAPLAKLVRAYISIEQLKPIESDHITGEIVIGLFDSRDGVDKYLIMEDTTDTTNKLVVGLRHDKTIAEIRLDFFKNHSCMVAFYDLMNPDCLNMASVRFTNIHIRPINGRVDYNGELLANMAKTIYEFLRTGDVFVTKRFHVPFDAPGNVC